MKTRFNSSIGSDWKQQFAGWCKHNISNLSQFYECFEKVSWSKAELVTGLRVRQKGTTQPLNTSFGEVVMNSWYGRCVTFHENGNIMLKSRNQILLKRKVDYKIWFHDPNFFILSPNPLSTSSLVVDMKQLGNDIRNAYVYIGDKSIFLLNRDKAPCVDYNHEASFTNCVRLTNILENSNFSWFPFLFWWPLLGMKLSDRQDASYNGLPTMIAIIHIAQI